MKVVIIEDESLAARRLAAMIKSHDPSIEILASLESVKASVDWFQRNPHPDLIFLDIHLEDDLSFAIFDQVEVSSSIIFTTAFDEYAIKAFKMKSIDYLLKPIVQDELAAALRKYEVMTGSQPLNVDLKTLYGLISQQSITYRERFSVTVGQKIKTFNIGEVAYFTSDEGYTSATLTDGKQYFLDLSLESLGHEVNPKDFFRVNRKILLSIHAIKEVHLYPKSRLKLTLTPEYQGEVFVSADKSAEFKKWLGTNK